MTDVVADRGSELARAHEETVGRELDTQYRELKEDAQALYRAARGRRGVHTEDQCEAICERAQKDYASGRFLIEWLGAERYLDPEMMATLMRLRQLLLRDVNKADAARMMCADLAVLAFYNSLRIQGWVGNLSLVIERELFGQNSLQQDHGGSAGKTIEDRLRRLGEQLLPLLDRSSRMMLRNLKALEERQAPSSPLVAVVEADQVNIAQQQVNITQGPAHNIRVSHIAIYKLGIYWYPVRFTKSMCRLIQIVKYSDLITLL